MLNRQTRQLFIHVPRTAGTLIAHLTGWPLDTAHGWGLLAGTGLELTHLTALQYIALFGEDEFWTWERVAVVRDPYDRIVSEYCYYRAQGYLPYLQGLERFPTFEEYIRMLDVLRFHDKSEWPHWRKSHLHTQVEFICNNEQQPLTQHVWRYENLAAHIGAWFGVVPGVMNESKRDDVQHTDETREITRRVYRADFEAFKYDH